MAMSLNRSNLWPTLTMLPSKFHYSVFMIDFSFTKKIGEIVLNIHLAMRAVLYANVVYRFIAFIRKIIRLFTLL